MQNNVMQVDLGRYATKCIIESLIKEEERLNQIGLTCDDEDVVAEVANDLVGLRGVLDFLKKKAVATFGEPILNFGKELL